jgi:SAM-dependent methyltransferase
MRAAIIGRVLQLIAPQMRAPGPGLGGWLAQKLMEQGNPPSIVAGIQRLGIERHHDVVVELGAGHGVGLRQAYLHHTPKRLVAVEISPAFYQKLETVKAELLQKQQAGKNSDHVGTIEIYSQDAKSMPFLEDNEVDKMFAMNVVYFLDPLPDYLREIHRVLKPGSGTVVFGCKFRSVRDAPPPFVNVRPEPIVQAMEAAGFEVSSQEVEVEGSSVYSYIEIKGIKKH